MATRNRYSDEEKKKVVDFVRKFDEENGRGGQSAAKKKFGINPISIKKWCVEQGYSGAGKTAKAKKKTTTKKATKKAAAKTKVAARGGRRKTTKKATRKKATRKTAAKAAAPKLNTKNGAARSDTLARLTAIQKEIASLESEFNQLKAKL